MTLRAFKAGLICLGMTIALPAVAQDRPVKRPKVMRELKGIKKNKGLRPLKARARDGMKALERDAQAAEQDARRPAKGLKRELKERRDADRAAHDRRTKLKKRGPKTAEQMRGLDGKAARKRRAVMQRAKARKHMRKYRKGPITAPIIEKQRRHARRMAKLNRIRELATAKNDSKTLERLDKLQGLEEARHAKWLQAQPGEPAAQPEVAQ